MRSAGWACLSCLIFPTLPTLACGASGAGDANATLSPLPASDASADPGPIQGSPGGISLKTDASVRVVQGRQAKLTVAVGRTGTRADVDITVEGLPAGVTVAAAKALEAADSVELTFDTDAAVTHQGDTAKITLRGRSGSSFASTDADLLVAGAPGTLDETFGTHGVVHLGVFAGSAYSIAEVRGAVTAPNGAIDLLVELHRNADGNPSAGFVRLKPNGDLDPSLAGSGFYRPPFDSVFPYGLLLTSKGKLLEYGNAASAGSYELTLIQLTDAGALDPTFGNQGRAVFHFDPVSPGGVDEARDAQLMTIAGVEKLVTVGRTNNNTLLAQFMPDGTVDPSFNDGKPVNIPQGAANDVRRGLALAVRSDNTRLVSVLADTGSDPDANLRVFSFDGLGAPIATFGAGNSSSIAIAKTTQIGSQITTLTDGSILAAGMSSTHDLVLAHADSTGKPASAYDVAGFASAAFALAGIHALPNQRAIAAATAVPANGARIARYTQTGALDPNWGNAGVADVALYTDLSQAPPYPSRTITRLQADGRLLVASGGWIGRVWD